MLDQGTMAAEDDETAADETLLVNLSTRALRSTMVECWSDKVSARWILPSVGSDRKAPASVKLGDSGAPPGALTATYKILATIRIRIDL